MKTICLTFVLIFWLIITAILALSVIGWVALLPKINDSVYYKPQEELRGTWMRIGFDLKDSLIKDGK